MEVYTPTSLGGPFASGSVPYSNGTKLIEDNTNFNFGVSSKILSLGGGLNVTRTDTGSDDGEYFSYLKPNMPTGAHSGIAIGKALSTYNSGLIFFYPEGNSVFYDGRAGLGWKLSGDNLGFTISEGNLVAVNGANDATGYQFQIYGAVKQSGDFDINSGSTHLYSTGDFYYGHVFNSGLQNFAYDSTTHKVQVTGNTLGSYQNKWGIFTTGDFFYGHQYTTGQQGFAYSSDNHKVQLTDNTIGSYGDTWDIYSNGSALFTGNVTSQTTGTLSGRNDAFELYAGGSGYNSGASHDILWAQSGLALGRFGMQYDGGSTVDYVWHDAYNGGATSAELMRLTGNGNLGLGTTSPAPADGSARTFQIGDRTIFQSTVGEQTTFSNNAYYDGAWKYKVSAYASAIRLNGLGNAGDITFTTAGSGTAGATISNWDSSLIRMVIRNGGNVGIGTTSPAELLTIGGENGTSGSNRKALRINSGGFSAPGAYNAASNGDKIILYDNTSATYDARIGIGDIGDMWFKSSGNTSTTGQFRWFTGSTPTERMRMLGTGYLGLGTTAPDVNFNVNGTGVNFANSWYVNTGVSDTMATKRGIALGYDSASQTGLIMGNSAGAASSIAFINFSGSAWNESMRINSAGDVGIATASPSARLHLISTTEQERIGYDVSNYYKTTVGSTGGVTFDAVGSGASFLFSDKVSVSNPVNLKGYTVATLPTGVTGDVAYVTDALAPSFLVTIVGGGTVVTPVFFNGTNWVAQ